MKHLIPTFLLFGLWHMPFTDPDKAWYLYDLGNQLKIGALIAFIWHKWKPKQILNSAGLMFISLIQGIEIIEELAGINTDGVAISGWTLIPLTIAILYGYYNRNKYEWANLNGLPPQKVRKGIWLVVGPPVSPVLRFWAYFSRKPYGSLAIVEKYEDSTWKWAVMKHNGKWNYRKYIIPMYKNRKYIRLDIDPKDYCIFAESYIFKGFKDGLTCHKIVNEILAEFGLSVGELLRK